MMYDALPCFAVMIMVGRAYISERTSAALAVLCPGLGPSPRAVAGASPAAGCAPASQAASLSPYRLGQGDHFDGEMIAVTTAILSHNHSYPRFDQLFV